MGLLNEDWGLFCSKLKGAKTTSNGSDEICPAYDDKKPA